MSMYYKVVLGADATRIWVSDWGPQEPGVCSTSYTGLWLLFVLRPKHVNALQGSSGMLVEDSERDLGPCAKLFWGQFRIPTD